VKEERLEGGRSGKDERDQEERERGISFSKDLQLE
jgi:hypothetical protein